MAIMNPIGIDQTTGQSRSYVSADVLRVTNIDSSAGLVIGGSTATSIAIGRSGIITDFLPGSTVDFTSVTVTGLSGAASSLSATLAVGNTTGDSAMVLDGSTAAFRTINGEDGDAPMSITVRGSDAPSSGGGGVGGDLILRAGDGDTSGSSGSNGGSVTITAGDGDDGGGGGISLTSGTTADIAGSGDISLSAPSAYFPGSINLTTAAGGPGGDGAINLTAPHINFSAIAGGGFGTEKTIDIEQATTGGTINIGTMNDPTINIGNAMMDSVTANRGSVGATDDSNGLILIDAGGTKIGGLTGPTITLGPVYYDPNNGMRIRFGNSIYLDGDGTVNTISGRDATVKSEEILTKIGATDATASLASIGPIADDPLTPGSVTLQVLLAGGTTYSTVTDDGAGAFASGAVLPAGGTIVYATGVMTGTTATLESTSEVIVRYLIDDLAGEALTPRGGTGVGAGAGGPLNLKGGAGGATGAGGDITLISGAGGSTSGGAGSIDIAIGTTTSGTPGTVQINSLPLPTVLGQATSVALASTGTTTLYTVPTGLSALVTGVMIEITAATAAAGDAVVSIGTNASTYDDIIVATTLTGLDATTEAFMLLVEGNIHKAAAAEVITFQVDTADTGTTLTATVNLIGFLV